MRGHGRGLDGRKVACAVALFVGLPRPSRLVVSISRDGC